MRVKILGKIEDERAFAASPDLNDLKLSRKSLKVASAKFIGNYFNLISFRSTLHAFNLCGLAGNVGLDGRRSIEASSAAAPAHHAVGTFELFRRWTTQRAEHTNVANNERSHQRRAYHDGDNQ